MYENTQTYGNLLKAIDEDEAAEAALDATRGNGNDKAFDDAFDYRNRMHAKATLAYSRALPKFTNTLTPPEVEEPEEKPTNDEATETEKSYVTVTYVDEKDKELAPSEKIEGEVGSEYKTERKDIEGYTLKEVKGEETGTITAEHKEVEYVYAVKGVYAEAPDDELRTGDTNPSSAGSKTVDTGDDTNVLSIVGILALSAAALGVVAVRRRRED